MFITLTEKNTGHHLAMPWNQIASVMEVEVTHAETKEKTIATSIAAYGKTVLVVESFDEVLGLIKDEQKTEAPNA